MDDESVLEETTQQREDLVNLSLQEVQQLRQKLGIKKFNKLYGSKKGHVGSATQGKKSGKNSGPIEISSKRPKNPSNILATSGKSQPVSRDPRFDDLSGNYDEELYKRSYKFIDRLKAKEIKAVRKIAEDEELDDQTRKKAKDMLTRMGQRKAAKKETSAEIKVDKTLKEERKKAIKEGQKPFFLKAGEKNKLVLAEKYKELKKKGQLESFMKKKRKQNAKMDAGSMPERAEK